MKLGMYFWIIECKKYFINEIKIAKKKSLPIILILNNWLSFRFEHFCAFCNLSESSVLGQGKLTNFKPTADFNCFESMEQKSANMEKTVEVSSEAGSELKLFFRKQKSLESG